jgi:hypothetical protein
MRGISRDALKITSRSPLDLPFLKTKGGAWRSCGEESFLELDGYIPRADEVSPLDFREAPPVHLDKGLTPHSLYLIPFTLFTGVMDGHPVRFLIDSVTGELYTADLPDLLSRRRIRRNRMTLLFLMVSSFILTFFVIGAPLLLLLSLTALFFLGLVLLKGG